MGPILTFLANWSSSIFLMISGNFLVSGLGGKFEKGLINLSDIDLQGEAFCEVCV